MIISTKELYAKYNTYLNVKDKVRREIQKGTYIKITRGIYEDNKNAEGYCLASVIEAPSYLSFEYVLSKYGLIKERVNVYTSATCLKKHNKIFTNYFGNYSYSDVPLSVWRYGLEVKQENGYSYMIATPEKALCDLLYKKPQVKSLKELKSLLFDNLRIEEEDLLKLNKNDIVSICDSYKKKNLQYLKKYFLARG